MTPPEPRIADMPGAQPGQPKQPETPDAARPPRSRQLKLLESKLTQLYLQPALIARVALQARMTVSEDGHTLIAPDEATARIGNGVENYVTLVPPTVESWMELAEQNPRVRSMLEGIVDGSVIGTLVVNHLMMVVPFLPPELLQRANPFAMRQGPGRNGNGSGYAP